MTAPRIITTEAAAHFRALLRAARAHVLADAEGFDGVICAVEQLNKFVAFDPHATLGKQSALIDIVGNTTFESIYPLFVEARNDRMHQGAAARRLAKLTPHLRASSDRTGELATKG